MIIYVCPHCQTPSAQMRLSDERMEPTPEQRSAYPEHDPIGHEILICKCGEPLTWYDLKPTTGYESFAEGFAAGVIENVNEQIRAWAQRIIELNESARQATVAFGLVINLDERLADTEKEFKETKLRIAELAKETANRWR